MSRLELISQLDKKDCGITCLLMILKYYGGEVSREYLRILAHQDQYGVSAYYLIEAASNLGLEGKGVTGSLEELTNDILPCIAHVHLNQYEHFVVIEKINHKSQYIYILDPARGKLKYSFMEYQKISTNQYLCFRPKVAKLPVLKEEKRFSRFCFSFFYHQWYLVFAILFCMLLSFLLELVITYHLQWILDYGVAYQKKTLLSFFLLFVVMLIIFIRIIHLIQEYFTNHLLQKFQLFISEKVIQHILYLPYQYHQYHTAGELISKFSFLDDILYILFPILNGISSTIIFIILLVLLGRIHRYFFYIFFLFMIAQILIMKIEIPIINKMLNQTKGELTLLNSKLTEYFYGLGTIKSMHIEEDIFEKIKVYLFHYLIKLKKLKLRFKLNEEGKSFIRLLIEHLLLTYGGLLLLQQRIILSNLLMVSFLSRLAIHQCEVLLELPSKWENSKTSFEQLNDLFSVEQEDFSYGIMTLPNCLNGLIQLKKLCFSIKEDEPLFQDVTLTIDKGTRVALLGSSGSGKSTFLKILMRYYEVSNQMIYLDNRDILSYPLEIIRENICYVSQEEVLFSDTVYQNIILNQKIDYDEFLTICKITEVDSIVASSLLGYQYKIEENGVNLSGGERQRIILARALAKKARIYLFDESFNQLDILRERRIMKAMFNYLEGRTILVVSHRKNNLDLFSRRIVLDDKKLIDDYLYFR